jgi:hypothetical protein
MSGNAARQTSAQARRWASTFVEDRPPFVELGLQLIRCRADGEYGDPRRHFHQLDQDVLGGELRSSVQVTSLLFASQEIVPNGGRRL